MPKTNPHGLTDQQFAFCQAYVRNGFQNGAKAYGEAYPKSKASTRPGLASRMLRKNAKVRRYLEGVQQRASEKTEITAERVLEELGRVGFANARDYFDWGPDGVTVKDSVTLTPTQTAAISEVSETITKDGGTIRVKMHDKIAALDRLGRHFAMFTDRRGEEFGGEPEIREVVVERSTKPKKKKKPKR